MKAFAAFENTVYQKKLERKVFAFCRRRQPKLLRYLPRYLAADVCRFFHGISREEYLRRRWSFLKDVEKPAAKLERFFHSKWYRTLTELDPEILMQEAKRQADINVERWERGRAKARERAERKAAKKNLSAAAVM